MPSDEDILEQCYSPSRLHDDDSDDLVIFYKGCIHIPAVSIMQYTL